MSGFYNMLAIQKLLMAENESTARSNDDLWATFNIKSKICLTRSTSYRTAPVHLYYSEGNKIHPQREANCLVLDAQTDVVCHAFPKIPLYGSKSCEFSWTLVSATQWLDGVLISVGKHLDSIVFAANDSALSLYKGEVFHETMGSSIKALHRTKEILQSRENLEDMMGIFENEHCFNFVLVGPEFSKVTPWEKDKLFLVSIFDRTFMEESDHRVLGMISRTKQMPTLDIYELSGEIKINEAAIPPLAKGLILKDTFGRRAYIPNSTYFLLEKILKAKEPSLKDMAQIVIAGHGEDVGHHYEQFAEVLSMLVEAFDMIKRQVMDAYHSYRQYTKLKTLSMFGMQERKMVRKHLFNLWRGNYKSEQDFRDNIRPRELIKEARRLFGKDFQKALGNLYSLYKLEQYKTEGAI